MKRFGAMLAALAVAAILLSSCVNGDGGADGAAWPIQFDTRSLAGEKVTQSDFAGNKLTVLNVFATWCAPCVRELPELGKVALEYADKGVQMVGLLEDGVDQLKLAANEAVIEQARTLLSGARADYLVILPDQALWNEFVAGLQYVPTTFFLDGTGKVVETLIGSRDAAGWSKEIDAVLARLDNP
ncbi:MAG: TlpA family protein disulfide reductase [Oscillospiraceae bacterium]|jgi:thiol-disulfide isomerase/thioredoxin|nr:TlpA family protein disulfide reductase [Oscillospiraceae bacterium]